MRNRTSDLRIPRSDALPPELKRLYGEQGLLQSSYMTRVLHSAKISNFDSVILCKWNKKDGNLRLGEGNFAGVR